MIKPEVKCQRLECENTFPKPSPSVKRKYCSRLCANKAHSEWMKQERADLESRLNLGFYSEETRQKISKSKEGITYPDRPPPSKETREKISKTLSGRPRDPELSQRASETMKLKWLDETFRRRHSEWMKSVWAREGMRERLSEAFRGRVVSEETRQKMSKSQKSLWDSEEFRLKESLRRRGFKWGVPTTGHVGPDGYFYLCTQYDHPLASCGVISQHRFVLWSKLGCEVKSCEHECYWCGTTLFWNGIEGICADHLNGVKLDNRPENLVPSCCKCNSRRALLGNPTVFGLQK